MLEQLLAGGKTFIYFSPLRALAEEFAASMGKRAIFVRERSQLQDALIHWRRSEAKALILTPEVLGDRLDELFGDMDRPPLFVLDEFHLFFRWGLSFRPILWELLLGIWGKKGKIWGLTATVDSQMEIELQQLCRHIEGDKVRVDLGNMRLIYRPQKTHYYPEHSWGKKLFVLKMMRELDHLEKNKLPGTILLFVPYRHQVDHWLCYLRRRGISVLGCVGGEVKQFVQRLNISDPPRCIVSTSALSHGVNLPQVHAIYIFQKLKDPTFWVQMTGRGGRRGESYQLHTFDNEQLSYFDQIKSLANLTKESCFLTIRGLFTV